MYRRPLVVITLIYICGIIFGKYCSVPQWLYVPLIIVFSIAILIIRSKLWKRIVFYLSIFIIGYSIYQITGFYEPENPYFQSLLPVKEYIRKFLYYNFPLGEERSLLSGLLLGERHKISTDLLNIFRCTNTVHILAISGLHVGFVGLIFIGVLRLVFVPRKPAALLAIIGICLYVTIVGWRPPAFRSAVIFCILFIGWILDRPVDSINSLSLAALVILLIAPQALFRIGFQLSFVIVLTLLLMSPVIVRQNNYIYQMLSGSTVAWLGSLPLIAYYFSVISPISILANLVVVPAIGVVIALGFTSILLGQLYMPISGVFNCVNYHLLKGLIWSVKCLAYVPGGYFYNVKFPLYIVFLYYIILGVVFFFLLQKRSFMIE